MIGSFSDLDELVDVIRRCVVRDAVAEADLKLLKVVKFEERLTIFFVSLSLKSVNSAFEYGVSCNVSNMPRRNNHQSTKHSFRAGT